MFQFYEVIYASWWNREFFKNVHTSKAFGPVAKRRWSNYFTKSALLSRLKRSFVDLLKSLKSGIAHCPGILALFFPFLSLTILPRNSLWLHFIFSSLIF